MNTTYLHRAKRQDNNEWVEGSLVHDPDLDVFDIFGFNYYSGENGREREEFSYRIIPETIGQYTGKEIAENRITDLHCYEHMRKVFVDDVIVIYSVHYNDADNLMRDVVATVRVKWDEEYHMPFAECIKGSYGDISSECDISYLEDGFDLPFTYFIEYMENSTSLFWDWEVIGNAHDNPELLQDPKYKEKQKMEKQAVYGEDKNGIMRLIARDLDASHAKEKADEYWKNTGRAAVIVKQQHSSSVMDKVEDCVEDLEAENARLRTTVESYATSARVIALYLDRWFDRNLPYSDGIAEAARKAANYIEELERKLNSNQ